VDRVTPFDSIVRDILARVNLVQVVSEYVPLKKRGRSYLGLCPFHQEKTPSFNVSEERQLYYCFGCQAGGNAVTFLKGVAGLSSHEALKRLAGLAGVELPAEGPSDPAQDAAARERSEMLHVLGIAQEVFEANLKGPGGENARRYLASRGINETISTTYGLGFGGLRHGDLLAELERRKASVRHASEVGLTSLRQDGGNEPYDRFRGRLLCPIFNLDGAVIGFSGRLIPPVEDGPKYLNSPESRVFLKGECVFGLYQARRAIRQSGEAILVEGNFDVLALAAAGLQNVVAPLGTALTSSQLRLLKRFTDKVVVMFDGDEAGHKASRRSVALLIEAGIEGRIAALPEHEDPDSFVRAHGAEAFRAEVARARPMAAWFVESLISVHGNTPHALRKVVEEAKEVFSIERDPFRFGLYRQELARQLDVDVREIRSLLRDPTTADTSQPASSDCPALELQLLELLLLHTQLIEQFLAEGQAIWLTNTEARDLLGELLNIAMTGEDPAEHFVTADPSTATPLRMALARILITPEKYPSATAKEAFSKTLASLESVHLAHQREALRRQLDAAQVQGNDEEVSRLQREQLTLARHINEIASRIRNVQDIAALDAR